MIVYEEPGYLKISGYKGRFSLNRYEFICPACHAKTLLGTDGSKDGLIGYFRCPSCNEEFLAIDDACDQSDLHVHSSTYGDLTLADLAKF